MGLLDNLGNLSPEQTQGLLGFASNMLQAGGPSRMPIGFGQALGAGLQGYQGSVDAARRQKLEEEQARQIAEMRGLQIQEAQGSLQQHQFLQDRQKRIQSGLAGLGGNQSSMPSAQMDSALPSFAGQPPMASAAPGIGPLSPKSGGPDWLQAYQAQQQLGQLQAPQSLLQPQRKNSTEAYAQRLIAEAEVYSREGDFGGADQRYQAAVKMLPQVDKIETAMQNGQPVRVITFKDGTEKVSSFDAKPDMVEVGLGDRKQFVDKNRLTNGQQFKVGVSPDSVYSSNVTIRGQNLVNARAQEANAIAGQNNVIGLSTGLRKEFDDLPEVKNYKQALPAYNAIVDASARSTPQSDINLVYAIAKLYDPNSVVREGEYATVANSTSIPERVKGWAQHLNGGGRLTEKVKEQIMQEAAGRMKSFEGPFINARQNYENIAQQSGGVPSMIFPSQYQSPVSATGDGSGKKASEKPPRSKIVKLDGGGSATGVLGADGNYYVKRDGKTYRVEDN